MDHRLIEGLMEVVAPYIKDLEKQCKEMQARIAQLEARAPEKGEPGEPGKDGKPGNDAVVDLDELALKAAALIDKPKDGVDGLPGKDAEPIDLDALAQKAVELIRVPKDGSDGVGVKALLTDADGQLVVTLSNGEVQRAGRVVGRDGQDGKPGDPGKDGVDGLGFEDMDEFLDEDGRTVVRRYSKGDVVKEFRHKFQVPLEMGIWKDGQEYEKGDGVTFGGSFWFAQKHAPQGRPDSGNKDWRLGVKKGRDGKDGSAPPPPPGPIHVPGAKSGR